MKYLRGTRDLTLSIEPGNRPSWWVDSLCVAHADMRSHSEIYMS